jgi:spore coat polysaccharide biosynthesis protein SpsF (cytidylyltransferase family)
MREGRVIGILQARMSSFRLPGKVLKPILGQPMLARQLERLQWCQTLDGLVVATSNQPDDDSIAKLCAMVGVDCFRGSLNNLIDRFYHCALEQGAEFIVRLTGDCPLSDAAMIDELVHFFLRLDVDYASNCRPPTLPDGLDAEVFTMEALATAWRESLSPFEREHVTPFIINRPERFTIANWEWFSDFSWLRWTVDEPEDFTFISKVYEALYPSKPDFGFDDVLALLKKQPCLVEINRKFQRNEGSKIN